MEYELIDAGPCRKKLSLKFSREDIDTAFDESYQEINNYVKLKGFRKGKAPRRVLENKFRDEAASGAKQHLAEKNISDVIKKEELKLIGEVMPANPDAVPAPGQAFDFDVEFNVIPEFGLPEYKGLDIAEQPVEVTEEKVDEALERYRRMFANYEEVDEPAQVGDILKVDFVTKVDDADIMSMDDQRLRVEGDILFGLPCPDLEQKFAGAKKGDTVTIKVTLPDDHPNPEMRGREADVVVSVKSVERGKLPELDDAFCEGLGVGSLADFRERIRGGLVRDALLAAKQKEEDEIINTLLERVSFDIPEDMVTNETNTLVEQQRMHLMRSGVKPGAAMDTQMEKYRPEAEKEAARKVRWGILSSKIAEKENIQVSNEDLAQQVDALAQNYNTTPAKIIQRIREFDGVGPMVAEILSIKVIQFLGRNAKGRENGQNDTGSVNAEAAESVKGANGEGDGCSCGHDHHDHGHHHHHEHHEGGECSCGHDH